MSRIVKTLALLTSVITLAACNENRDDNMALPSQQTSFKGLVLGANAIQGAIVCLDTNDNLLCEAQEPQAKTNQLGIYQFDTNALMAKQASIVAYIPQGAMDVVTKEVIDKPYTLTTPTGKHAVISPLTSFVMETMRLHQGMDIDTASQIVSYQLKAKDFDVFKDYRGDNSTEGALAKQIAKSASIYLQNTLYSFKQSKPQNIEYKDIMNIASYSRLLWLYAEIPFTYHFYELFNYQNEIGFNLNNDEYSTTIYHLISNRIDNHKISEEPILFSLSCIHYLCDSIDNTQHIKYKKIIPTSLNHLDFKVESRDFDIKSVKDTISNNTENTYILENDKWVNYNLSYSLNSKNYNYYIFLYDLSNTTVESFGFLNTSSVNSHLNFPFLFKNTTKFPYGAYAYKIFKIKNNTNTDFLFSTKDKLNSVPSITFFKNENFNKNYIPLSKFIALSFTGISNDSLLIYKKDIKLNINPDNTLNLIVENFKPSSNTSANDEEAELESIKIEKNQGHWFEMNNNTKILQMNSSSLLLAKSFLTNDFITEFENNVYKGTTQEKGYISEEILFNETAFNAIKTAAISNP